MTILNKFSLQLGPRNALLLALAFPVGYAGAHYIKSKKIGALSILGLLNVLVTGGLALAGLTGIWFSVKEAAFPLLVGLFVFGSAFTKNPFVESLLLNPQVMDVEKLEARLVERGAQQDFHGLLKKGTQILSLSFLLSAITNFVLGLRIFTPIDINLSDLERAAVLNDQIAKMTGLSFGVIVVPSMIFMGVLFFYLLNRLEKITGDSYQNYVKSN